MNERQKKATKAKYLEQLELFRGIQGAACKATGVSHPTIRKWREQDKEFDDAVIDILLTARASVESKLLEAIDDGDTKAITYYLKTHHYPEDPTAPKPQGDAITMTATHLRDDMTALGLRSEGLSIQIQMTAAAVLVYERTANDKNATVEDIKKACEIAQRGVRALGLNYEAKVLPKPDPALEQHNDFDVLIAKAKLKNKIPVQLFSKKPGVQLWSMPNGEQIELPIEAPGEANERNN